YPKTIIEEGCAGWGVAQGAPDKDLKMLCCLVHQANRERGLTNTTQAQHTHNSTAVFDQPFAQLAQFPLPPIEGRYRQGISPVCPMRGSPDDRDVWANLIVGWRSYRFWFG